jgi:hypothetical protein
MSTSPSQALLEVSSPAERRAWQRLSTRLEVFYQYKNEANEEVFGSGQVVNISRGGLRVLCCQRMEPGTVFRIGIADGDNGLFTLLMARAIYVASASDDKWAVGCTFTPKLREEILAWLEKIGRED